MHLERAIGIHEALLRDQPGSPQIRHSLARMYRALAGLRSRRGRRVEARTLLRKGRAIADAQASEAPSNPEYQQVAAALAIDLGMLATLEGNPAEGLRLFRQALERLGRVAESNMDIYYARARAHAQLGLAGADQPATHFETAIAMLRCAVVAGYRDRPEVAADPALEPLRARADFPLLMMDLAMPLDPFSP
jgi:hypothetical protein